MHNYVSLLFIGYHLNTTSIIKIKTMIAIFETLNMFISFVLWLVLEFAANIKTKERKR